MLSSTAYWSQRHRAIGFIAATLRAIHLALQAHRGDPADGRGATMALNALCGSTRVAALVGVAEH